MTLTKTILEYYENKDLTKLPKKNYKDKDLTKLPKKNSKDKDIMHDKPIELADRDSLGVRISLKGKIVWQFRYRYREKAQRLTLGSYPYLKIPEARDKLSELKGWLAEGKDPKQMLAVRKNKNLEKAQYTLIKLASDWKETLSEDKLKVGTIDNYINVLDKWILNAPKRDKLKVNWVIKKLNMPFDDIRGSDWMTYFSWICEEGSPIVAGSVLKLIKSIVKWGFSTDKITNQLILQYKVNNVGRASTPAERTPSAEEVAYMWLEIEKSKALPQTKLCMKLIILFGGRNTAVRTMKWEHLDFKNLIWTIPMPKGKKEHRRRGAFDENVQRPEKHPIPEEARRLLMDFERIYGNKGYVFKGEIANKPVTVHAVDRFCRRMTSILNRTKSIPQIIPHDFRRSLNSILCEIDVKWDPICEKILGHKLKGTKAHYNKADYLRQQLEAYELYWSVINKEISKLVFEKTH
jgi:integrase